MIDRKQKGEGDYEAARRFNKKSTEFIQNNKEKISKAAQSAKHALNTSEQAELKRAEIEGKRHAKEENPEISKPKVSHKNET
jgi:hypothetical protein